VRGGGIGLERGKGKEKGLERERGRGEREADSCLPLSKLCSSDAPSQKHV